MQIAAGLAVAFAAHTRHLPSEGFDGERLIDSRLLNVVLVLVVTTSILGPVLAEHFAPRLLKEATRSEAV